LGKNKFIGGEIVAKNKSNKKPAQDTEFASETNANASNRKQQPSSTPTQNTNK
jgi:hypothetical protein